MNKRPAWANWVLIVVWLGIAFFWGAIWEHRNERPQLEMLTQQAKEAASLLREARLRCFLKWHSESKGRG